MPWSHWLRGTEGDVTNLKELMKGKVNFRLALQLASGGGLKYFWQVVSFCNTVFLLFLANHFNDKWLRFWRKWSLPTQSIVAKIGNNSDFDGETVSRLPLIPGLLQSTLTLIRPLKLVRLPSKLPWNGTRTTESDLPVSGETGRLLSNALISSMGRYWRRRYKLEGSNEGQTWFQAGWLFNLLMVAG